MIGLWNPARRRWALLLVLAVLAVPTVFLFADGNEILVWVKYDAEKKLASLSNGSPAPEGATPGQFYEIKRGKLKLEKQWRSPLDFIRSYRENEAGRVEFSHERHFAALNKKTCNTCHDEARGLGADRDLASKASSASEEPHGKRSLGRFCAGCHDGAKRISDVEGAGVKVASSGIFTALGRKSDPACARCHTPADHGSDYTSAHGDRAEHGRGAECATCHRGANEVLPEERSQAADYRRAQLALVKNPEDPASVQVTLANNFCLYCHNSDNKAWKDSKSSRKDKHSRERHSDD